MKEEVFFNFSTNHVCVFSSGSKIKRQMITMAKCIDFCLKVRPSLLRCALSFSLLANSLYPSQGCPQVSQNLVLFGFIGSTLF